MELAANKLAGNLNQQPLNVNVDRQEVQLQNNVQANPVNADPLQYEGFQAKDQEYYRSIVKKNIQDNERIAGKRVRIVDEGEWTVVDNLPSIPKQKLPSARDTYKARKAEDAEIKKAKRTFKDADYCTIREGDSLTKYFSKWPKDENGNPKAPVVEGHDAVNDPELMKYADSVLSFHLSEAKLTDEYLSDHMAEIYEYSRKLNEYNELKTRYPKFFLGLSEAKRADLETRAATAEDLQKLLDQHLKLHGLVVADGAVSLRKETRDKKLRKPDREREEAAYEKARVKFFRQDILKQGVLLAKKYTEQKDVFGKDALMNQLRSQIASNEAAVNACGEELNGALAEMEKAFALRDEMLLEMNRLLGMMADVENHPEQEIKVRKSINKLNGEIAQVNAHADHYREFINMVTGVSSGLSKETTDLFEARGQSELLRLAHFKAVGDCLAESKGVYDLVRLQNTYNEKAEALQQLKENKKTPKAQIQAAEQELKELERQLNVKPAPGNMDRERFYTKWAKAKNRLQQGNKFINTYEEEGRKVDLILGEGKTRKAELGLSTTADRISLMIRDPGNLLQINRGLISIAFGSQMNGDTPEELRAQIENEVMRPIIDELMKLTPEKLEKLQFPEDPEKDLNVEDPEFWKTYTLMGISADTVSFLDSLRHWNVSVSDEEYRHLTSLKNATEGLYGVYQKYFENASNPAYTLTEDMELDDILDLKNNCLEEYGTGKYAMVDEYLERYDEKAKGMVLEMKTSTGRKASFHVYDYMLEMLGRRTFQLSNEQGNISVTDQYQKGQNAADQKIRKQKQEDDPELLFEKEKEAMKKYYPDFGDYEARMRVNLKLGHKNYDKRLSTDMRTKWTNKFGSKDMGGDLRSIQYFLKPVEYDLNGAIKKESLEAYQENVRFLNDLMSEEEEKRAVSLTKIAKEIAAIRFRPEMLSLEYFREHYEEVSDMMDKIHGFQNIMKEYPGFFESEHLTVEERDRIRKYFIDSDFAAHLTGAYGFYQNSFGVNVGNGQDVEYSDETEELKIQKAKQNTESMRGAAEMALNTMCKDELEKIAEGEQLYQDPGKASLYRESARLNACLMEQEVMLNRDIKAQEAALKKCEKSRDEKKKARDAAKEEDRAKLTGEYDTLSNQAKQTKTILEKRRNELERLKVWTAASAELRKFYRGTITKEQLSDSAKLFSARNGLELFSEEEIRQAEFNVEKQDMQKNWQYTDDRDVRLRIIAKKVSHSTDGSVDTKAEQEFIEKTHNNPNHYDSRCYVNLLGHLRPVMRDVSGKVLKSSEKNLMENNQAMRDFASGDQELRGKLLHDFAMMVIDNVELQPEKYTDEYIVGHMEELLKVLDIKFNFQNVYTGNLDYFESDAFTDEQKDKLRMIMQGTAFDSLSVALTQYVQKLGVTQKGDDVELLGTKEDKERILKSTIKTSGDMQQQALMIFKASARSEYENMQKVYAEKGTEVRRISVFKGQQVKRIRELSDRNGALNEEIKAAKKNLEMNEEEKQAYIKERQDQIDRNVEESLACGRVSDFLSLIRDILHGDKKGEDREREALYNEMIAKVKTLKDEELEEKLPGIVQETMRERARIAEEKKKAAAKKKK